MPIDPLINILLSVFFFYPACHPGAQRAHAAGAVALLLAPRLAQQQSHQEALRFPGLLGHVYLSSALLHLSALLPPLLEEKEKTLLSQGLFCKQ